MLDRGARGPPASRPRPVAPVESWGCSRARLSACASASRPGLRWPAGTPSATAPRPARLAVRGRHRELQGLAAARLEGRRALVFGCSLLCLGRCALGRLRWLCVGAGLHSHGKQRQGTGGVTNPGGHSRPVALCQGAVKIKGKRAIKGQAPAHASLPVGRVGAAQAVCRSAASGFAHDEPAAVALDQIQRLAAGDVQRVSAVGWRKRAVTLLPFTETFRSDTCTVILDLPTIRASRSFPTRRGSCDLVGQSLCRMRPGRPSCLWQPRRLPRLARLR